MSIDTAAPRTRRAILAGAFGGLLASVAAFVKAPEVLAAPGDPLQLELTNTTAATTALADSSTGPAFRAVSATAVGLLGSSGVNVGSIPPPIATSTGVYGISLAGVGVYGASGTGPGIYAANNAETTAAIVAEGDPGTAIHGHGGPGPVGASPASTGIYGSAADDGTAIAADSASGLAVRATSSATHAIRGRGALDGTIGESTGGRSGIVGYSGTGGAAPAGPAKTGVYGEATQDLNSRGVSGFSLAGQGVRGTATSGVGVYGESTGDSASRGVFGKTAAGQAVRGEATGAGVGVRAQSATGLALDVSGKVKLNRSGIASVPANATYVDVTVPGGTSSTSIAFANMQLKRTGVYVVAARPNWPTSGKLRIYLNKVGSTTAGTPVAWWVL